MRLVDKMKSRDTLTPSENQIAQYILQNTSAVVNMTLDELAGNLYVSKSTILRFCKKLGYKGHKQLSVHLAQELNSFFSDEQEIPSYIPFLQGDDRRMIAEKVYGIHVKALSAAYQDLDADQIQRAARMIHDHKLVSVIAFGEDAYTGREFVQRLNEIGIHAGFHDSPDQAFRIHTGQEGDLAVLVIAYDSRSPVIAELCESLQKKKIPVILISGMIRSSVRKFVTECIEISFEEDYPKIACFGSRTAVTLTADVLYSVIFGMDYGRNLNIIKAHAETRKRFLETQEGQS